ncbi:MAG: hypothetical protein HZB39_09005 [Planctomycetes bacterium]|nr:hypothetical protein [Planctomycetota bacterium]
MPRLAPLAFAALAVSLPAQSIDLSVDGGSIGGTLQIRMAGGTPGQAGFIFLSLLPGPTPLSLIDPSDPRSLSVGFDLLGLTIASVLLVPPEIVVPPLAIPNDPGLIDGAMFFQAVTAPGFASLVDRISLPRAVRFGPPNAFRDRFVALANPRSFFPVIPGTDGRTLVPGGGAGALFAQIARKDTEWFDPISETFSAGQDMTIERSLHTATRLADGRWLVVGGVDRLNDPTATAEIFDPANGSFTAVASMVLQRAGHAAALLPNGRVLVSGGITDMNAPSSPLDPVYSITTSTEIYDPVANTWSPGPALRKPRAGHLAITRADGRVLLAGGVSWYTFIIRLPSLESTTDLYTPATNAIAAGPAMRQARAVPAITSIGGGRWLLAGGIGNLNLTQQGTPTTAAELYDEAANSFTATAAMAQARALCAAFPIGNNRYLVIGGGDGSLFAVTPLAGTEIWNATTGTWTAGPALTRPRVAYGAYATASGQIHVLGGESTGGVDLSTEFYFK